MKMKTAKISIKSENSTTRFITRHLAALGQLTENDYQVSTYFPLSNVKCSLLN